MIPRKRSKPNVLRLTKRRTFESLDIGTGTSSTCGMEGGTPVIGDETWAGASDDGKNEQRRHAVPNGCGAGVVG